MLDYFKTNETSRGRMLRGYTDWKCKCGYALASARRFSNKWDKSGRELPSEKRLHVHGRIPTLHFLVRKQRGQEKWSLTQTLFSGQKLMMKKEGRIG